MGLTRARHEDSDKALLAAFAAGDMRAARVLSDRLAPPLLRFAARMLGDRAEAEDIVQETMLEVWRIAPRWDPDRAKLSTWAFRVAANRCTDRLRRRRPVAEETGEDLADAAPDAPERLQQKAQAEALHQALLTLPERQRQAVVLRHLEGFTNPEISAVMGISVEAVESLTSRGKRALSAALIGARDSLSFEES